MDSNIEQISKKSFQSTMEFPQTWIEIKIQ